MSEAELGEWARLGVATAYEAADRSGLLEIPLTRLLDGSRVAGSARPIRCAPGDNLALRSALAEARPGDVLVVTSPDPQPIALLGDMLATRAQAQGVAAVVVDGAVRDVDALRRIGLPVWARWISARGPRSEQPGTIDQPIAVGGTRIAAGDLVVLDGDGAVAIARDRVDTVLAAARAREQIEAELRDRFAAAASAAAEPAA